MDRTNKGNPNTMTRSLIPVSVGQYFETFDSTVNVLNDDAFLGQVTVECFFCGRQRVMFRRFDGCETIWMQLCNALITTIPQDLDVRADTTICILE